MKPYLAWALPLAFCLPVSAGAKTLKVVATTPELVDVTRRVGGGLVEVSGLARGPEDIHQVVVRPSFVSKLNRADAVVYLGLGAEHSFLPALLSVAANRRLRSDPVAQCIGEGCVDCSEGVAVLDKPKTLSRAEGDVHPQGNPHYNLDPSNGPLIARNIAAGLSRIDPAHAAEYERNLKSYLAELEPKVVEWRTRVAALKGVKAVSYHKDVAYLGRFTGLEFVDALENKPGVAPTPSHLEQVVKKMKDQEVKLLVREQHFDKKTCEWVAKQTGAKIAVLSVMANAFPDTSTFIEFSEHNLKALLEAAK